MAIDPYTAAAIGVLDLGMDWLAGEEQADQQRKAANALRQGADNAESI